MNRRNFLLSGGAFLAGAFQLTPAFAQGTPLSIVKVMSFGCPVCFNTEAHDSAIKREVEALNGKFVWAPIPVLEEESGAREKVYYAARNQGEQAAQLVKSSLYKGSQELGIPLSDFLSLYTFLEQDLNAKKVDLALLFKDAQSADIKKAFTRAIRLALNAGVSNLPGYVILQGNAILSLADPTSVPGNSLIGLRDLLIERVKKAAQPL